MTMRSLPMSVTLSRQSSARAPSCRIQRHHHRAIHQVAGGVDQPRYFILTEHGWQALMMLGELDGIGQIGSPEVLDEQEPQSRSLSLDGARRELTIAEQVDPILADVVRPNRSVGRRKYLAKSSTAWMLRLYGVRKVVATLELIQHHRAKMVAVNRLVTHPKPTYRLNAATQQHPPGPRLRSNTLVLTNPRTVRLL